MPLAEEDLLEALRSGGLPCTPEELRQRFEAFLARALRGSDPRTTRLSLLSQSIVQLVDGEADPLLRLLEGGPEDDEPTTAKDVAGVEATE